MRSNTKKGSGLFNRLEGFRSVNNGIRVLTGKKLEQPRAGREVYDSSRWAKLAAEAKRKQPYCSKCGQSDKQGRLYADHVNEIKDSPHLAFAEWNIMVLCASCHATKTNEVKRQRGWAGTMEQINQRLDASLAKATKQADSGDE